MSVKVAVRVRPFNSREIELQSDLCIDMVNNTTVIKDLSSGGSREFTFDYSFWSHDGFDTREDGYYERNNDKYADQKYVFEKVGIEILDNAWLGYHCCLFAYGQTGAGKSYSMVGYGTNKGIVPISCEEIFKRIESNDNPNKEYQIQFSMLEIYNEKIQDLLIPINKRPAGGLKVREHKTLGVYVEDLTKHPVDSYVSIEAKTDEGNRNRTIGSTLMNASSSRAHTIITIEFKQIETIDGRKGEKLSIINLVDLAGSEKLSKTGATGDRMKEGCAINKSLTILGIVISSLAEKSSGKKNVIVPYRDSALTRILQNALGGNSKTLMICALSPATNNYDETLSTLRYADQAKKIKLHAVVNESEQDKMIRELREENEKLKILLQSFSLSNNPQGVILDGAAIEKIKDMEEQLRANSHLMSEYEKSFEERLMEAKLQGNKIEDEPIDFTKPFLMNLNEDPLLNGKLNASLQDEINHIGKRNGNPVPKLLLGGMGIKPNHAVIRNQNEKISIEPIDKECGEFIFLNGEKVFSIMELKHNDRLIFGTNTIYLVKIPNKIEHADPDLPVEIDWEFSQKELLSKIEKSRKHEYDELEKIRQTEVDSKIKLIEEQMKKEKMENEQSMLRQKDEYEKKLKELEEKMNQGGGDENKYENEKKEAKNLMIQNVARLEAEGTQISKEREKQKEKIEKQKDKHYLEHKLTKYLPKILEVNLIAKELKRNVQLVAKLAYSYKEDQNLINILNQPEEEKIKKIKIQIKVLNHELGLVFYWDVSKFSNRYFIIKDILDKYFETNKVPILSKEDDPFWDPPEPHIIGQGFLKLMSLGYLMDYSADLTIVGEKGAVGTVNVKIIPTDTEGEKNICNEMEEKGEIIEDPNELIGKRVDFNIVIESACLPEYFCTDTFAEYRLFFCNGNEKLFSSKIIKGKNSKPNYNYKMHHWFEAISDEIINYIMNSNLCIQIYGIEDINESDNNFLTNSMGYSTELNEIKKHKNEEGKENGGESNILRRSSLKLDESELKVIDPNLNANTNTTTKQPTRSTDKKKDTCRIM